MDEAHEILLSSLKSSGISIPVGVSTIRNLTSDALISICTQSIRLIRGSPRSSFSTLLPAATAERFKMCVEVASAIKSIGYGEELSFHQFLYPSDLESYKLVRFLVERLSDESTEGIQVCKVMQRNMIPERNETITEFFKGIYLDRHSVTQSTQIDSGLVPGHVRTNSGCEDSRSSDEYNSCKVGSTIDLFVGDDDLITEPEIKLSLQHMHTSKLQNEMELRMQEKRLMDEVHAKTLDVQRIQDRYDIMKVSFDLATNSQNSVQLCIEELDAKVKIRQQEVEELEMKSHVAERSLKQKGVSFTRSTSTEQLKVREKLLQLKEIEREIDSTLAEISKREAEHLDLLTMFEKQPKLPSRKSYIERITEIAKNGWKLDAGIQQIQKQIRELQLESISIQERLQRAHAVVDETVFREAKKDATGRKAYRLLTSIHDTFQQIAETILATDRSKREAAVLEAKLASLPSHGFDIAKLQADLDSIRKENEVLGEKSLHLSPLSAPL